MSGKVRQTIHSVKLGAQHGDGDAIGHDRSGQDRRSPFLAPEAVEALRMPSRLFGPAPGIALKQLMQQNSIDKEGQSALDELEQQDVGPYIKTSLDPSNTAAPHGAQCHARECNPSTDDLQFWSEEDGLVIQPSQDALFAMSPRYHLTHGLPSDGTISRASDELDATWAATSGSAASKLQSLQSTSSEKLIMHPLRPRSSQPSTLLAATGKEPQHSTTSITVQQPSTGAPLKQQTSAEVKGIQDQVKKLLLAGLPTDMVQTLPALLMQLANDLQGNGVAESNMQTHSSMGSNSVSTDARPKTAPQPHEILQDASHPISIFNGKSPAGIVRKTRGGMVAKSAPQVRWGSPKRYPLSPDQATTSPNIAALKTSKSHRRTAQLATSKSTVDQSPLKSVRSVRRVPQAIAEPTADEHALKLAPSVACLTTPVDNSPLKTVRSIRRVPQHVSEGALQRAQSLAIPETALSASTVQGMLASPAKTQSPLKVARNMTRPEAAETSRSCKSISSGMSRLRNSSIFPSSNALNDLRAEFEADFDDGNDSSDSEAPLGSHQSHAPPSSQSLGSYDASPTSLYTATSTPFSPSLCSSRSLLAAFDTAAMMEEVVKDHWSPGPKVRRPASHPAVSSPATDEANRKLSPTLSHTLYTDGRSASMSGIADNNGHDDGNNSNSPHVSPPQSPTASSPGPISKQFLLSPPKDCDGASGSREAMVDSFSAYMDMADLVMMKSTTRKADNGVVNTHSAAGINQRSPARNLAAVFETTDETDSVASASQSDNSHATDGSFSLSPHAASAARDSPPMVVGHEDTLLARQADLALTDRVPVSADHLSQGLTASLLPALEALSTAGDASKPHMANVRSHLGNLGRLLADVSTTCSALAGSLAAIQSDSEARSNPASPAAALHPQDEIHVLKQELAATKQQMDALCHNHLQQQAMLDHMRQLIQSGNTTTSVNPSNNAAVSPMNPTTPLLYAQPSSTSAQFSVDPSTSKHVNASALACALEATNPARELDGNANANKGSVPAPWELLDEVSCKDLSELAVAIGGVDQDARSKQQVVRCLSFGEMKGDSQQERQSNAGSTTAGQQSGSSNVPKTEFGTSLGEFSYDGSNSSKTAPTNKLVTIIQHGVIHVPLSPIRTSLGQPALKTHSPSVHPAAYSYNVALSPGYSSPARQARPGAPPTSPRTDPRGQFVTRQGPRAARPPKDFSLKQHLSCVTNSLFGGDSETD